MSLRTEEEAEALDKLDDSFAGFDYEDETGLPSIARAFGPADGSIPDWKPLEDKTPFM